MPATVNKVAVATTSALAAEAAAEIADCGGNAVDCAIAAAMFSINTEPGVCALAGSAYVTIWPPGRDPITIDGNVAIPGIDVIPGWSPAAEVIQMEYGGGIETMVGATSVAVPGTLAALHLASEQFGRLTWHELLRPTIRAARNGFPLSAACHYYLGYSGDIIFGRSDDGYTALHNEDGSLRDVKSNIVVAHLADTLEAIAEEGCRVFYEGYLGKRITDHVQQRGGSLTMQDLKSYRPFIRPSLMVETGDWMIATNPPPAVGGLVLSAMLLAFANDPFEQWDNDSLRRLVRVQQAALSYRKKNLDPIPDVMQEAVKMLELARSGEMISKWSSGATVHTSAVDDASLACAITASSGYGSGEMPAETGLWLNNCLGEMELNLDGLNAGPPGKRLPSNMAPGIARCSNQVLAMGSPGADRITTALHQFLVNFIQRGLTLNDAVAHPRMHLLIDETSLNIAVEPGLDIPDIGIPITRYPEIGMYFGGVVAALYSAENGFDVAADPRREGGTFISA
jgi:gamma-glutamyltranspeptidase/glutathione hydrolase